MWQAECERLLRAKQLQEEGEALLGAGNWAEAADKLAASLALHDDDARPEQNSRPALCGAHS